MEWYLVLQQFNTSCFVDTLGKPAPFLNRNGGGVDWGDGKMGRCGEGLEGEEGGEIAAWM